MIGFIKNIFNKILSFFIGLIGGRKSQENKPSLASSAQNLKEATTSSAQKLKEATTSSAQKLKEATASSTEKLAESTAKTSSGIVSSLTDANGKKQDKPNSKAATAKNRKRSGYFMELDETEEVSNNGSHDMVEPAGKTPVVKSEPANNMPVAKSEPAKTPGPVAPEAPKIELVQTTKGLKAEPVKPAKTSANGKNQTETTFAPKYLNPSLSSSSRRRPGPNMNNFLDMARQVKNPG